LPRRPTAAMNIEHARVSARFVRHIDDKLDVVLGIRDHEVRRAREAGRRLWQYLLPLWTVLARGLFRFDLLLSSEGGGGEQHHPGQHNKLMDLHFFVLFWATGSGQTSSYPPRPA